ncbi:MAG TPA: glycosyltransferase [Vicinamibacterales bacterium]|nr:glycosyltransferase [Vicinamibacterales bacterium]
MRVVQVNLAFDPALPSAEALLDRYATLTGWAEALARAGAEVLTVQQFHSSANVTRAGIGYAFGPFREIVRRASRWRADVVHINGLDCPLGIWRVSRLQRRRFGGAAFVVQDHASGVPAGAVSRAVRRRLLSGVDAFLFSALEQAQPWRDAGVIAPRQAVHDVMEASTAIAAVPREEARAASGVSGDPAVLWVGRLNANKDPLTVVDGFERFAAGRPGATLTMVFEGGEAEAAVRARVVSDTGGRLVSDTGDRAVSDTGGACGRIRLVGAVPHDRIAAFFSAADLFVSGSHHEGSGYALIEALACGAVPVVTAIPAFRAILGAGQVPGTCQVRTWHVPGTDPVPAWHLWTPGDAHACAAALDRAAAHIDRAAVIEHFQRNLTWDAVGRRALAVYREVAGRKNEEGRGRSE